MPTLSPDFSSYMDRYINTSGFHTMALFNENHIQYIVFEYRTLFWSRLVTQVERNIDEN